MNDAHIRRTLNYAAINWYSKRTEQLWFLWLNCSRAIQ